MKIKTIFDNLTEQNICFAVGVNDSVFKIKGVDDVKKEYFILILESDKDKAPVYFHRSNNQLCAEHEMDLNEISQFEKIKSKFDKIIHCDHGRIYEVKGNSFKQKYLKLNTDENNS